MPTLILPEHSSKTLAPPKVHHAYFEPTNGYYASRLMNHLGLTYGHIAVDMFIVVSGFCLMLPLARRGGRMPPLCEFVTQRALRILSPYHGSLLLSCLFRPVPMFLLLAASPPIVAAAYEFHLLFEGPFLTARGARFALRPPPGLDGSRQPESSLEKASSPR